MVKFKEKISVTLTPAHHFANVIDPRYQGKCLDADHVDIAERYVCENFLACNVKFLWKDETF